ncbi:MAG: hypothetical protein LC808_02545 [Actinobacteria bacterium]|nr:hypothetical protein [Actinomycetota bacterium]
MLLSLGIATTTFASHDGGDTTTLHQLVAGTAVVDGVLDASYSRIASLSVAGRDASDPEFSGIVGEVYMVYDPAGCGGTGLLSVFVQMLEGRTIDESHPQIWFFADYNGNGMRDADEGLGTAGPGFSFALTDYTLTADQTAVEFAVCYTAKPDGEQIGLRLNTSAAGATEEQQTPTRFIGQRDSELIGLTVAFTSAPPSSAPPSGGAAGGGVAGGRSSPSGRQIPNTATDTDLGQAGGTTRVLALGTALVSVMVLGYSVARRRDRSRG